MKINELIKQAHEAAIEKGFYDCPECEGKGYFEPVDNDGYPGGNCTSCNGTGKADRNIGELLMLVVSELGEALEAHRKNNLYGNLEYPDVITSTYLNCFEIEIADAFIRLFDLCGYLELDIEIEKTDYNCFDNVGEELFVWVAAITALPMYKDLTYENKSKTLLSWLFRRMERFCIINNIDIEKHIAAKMTYNKTREYKHGKEY